MLDMRKLNERVVAQTVDAEICHEKLRLWRKYGENGTILDLKRAYLQLHVCHMAISGD